VRAARPFLALGAVLVLAACGGSDEAEPELVFVSSRDGEYAIYALSGGDERRLTEAEIDPSTPQALFFQTEPAWSADGSTIAFASKRSGTFDLYAMGADGSGTRRLTSTKEDDGQPSWSPDGRRIVFVRGASGRLFVMAADGSGAHRLTDEEAEEGEPAWSPDGRWIVYVRKAPGSSTRELWLVRPDGSGKRRLTSMNAVALGPAWSPDTRQVVFSSNVDQAQFDIYIVDLARPGGDVRLLTSTRTDSFEPAWSPDGATIAYSEEGALHAVDLAGGEPRRLTDPANNDSSPAWSPRPKGEDD
jgi:TolB protein